MNDIERMRAEATSQSDDTIVVTREFDAPPQLVFRAFTDPRLMSRWFAPEPLTVPRAEMDVRVGGHYTIVMRDENGIDYPSTGVYREIREPERLVYTDSIAEMPTAFVDMVNEARGESPGTPIPDGIVTITCEDLGNRRTRMTFREDFDSHATRDAWVEMQMVEGLQMGFDNLDRVLEQERAAMR